MSQIMTVNGFTKRQISLCVGNDDGANSGCISAAVIAGAITLLLTLPVGVALGCCGMWCMMRRRHNHTLEKSKENMEQVQETIYDEPQETAIPLSENEAYGHI